MPAAAADPAPRSARARWSEFLAAASGDLRLLAWLLLVLAMVRLVLLAVFHGLADGAGFGSYIDVIAAGLRLDGKAQINYIWAGLLLASVRAVAAPRPAADLAGRLHRWYRRAVVVGFTAATVVAAVLDGMYISQFGRQFDHLVFNLFEDDAAAVLATVWKAYPVVWLSLGTLALAGGAAWAGLRLGCADDLGRDWFRRRGPAALGAIAVGMAALLVVVARGSVTRVPFVTNTAAVTGNGFLDGMIPSPWKALAQANRSRRQLMSAAGVERWLGGRPVGEALRGWTGGDGDDIDAAMIRHAAGAAAPPRHVWLVVVESYGAWMVRDRWAQLGLGDGLRRLGGEGALTADLASAGEDTMRSVSALISGVPYSGVPIHLAPSAASAFPTAPAAIFARLGYRTRLFYAGYGSWQGIAGFAAAQGFQEVVCGAALGASWGARNEWGVPDADLYRAALDRSDDATPTFNLVLTVSNHLPFDVDLPAAGWTSPVPVAGADAWNPLVMGHSWYADRQVERFCRELPARQPDVLVAVTGDHFGRQGQFPARQPDALDRATVPLLLWRPGVRLDFPPGTAGSHNDIAATLVERCAPAGFAYHAFGRDLLAGAGRQAGIGQEWVVVPGGAAWFGDRRIAPAGVAEADLPLLRRAYDDLHALAWWRVRRGPSLKP